MCYVLRARTLIRLDVFAIESTHMQTTALTTSNVPGTQKTTTHCMQARCMRRAAYVYVN